MFCERLDCVRGALFLFFCPCFGTNTFNTAENDHVTKVWPNSLREKDIAWDLPISSPAP